MTNVNLGKKSHLTNDNYIIYKIIFSEISSFLKFSQVIGF